MDNLDNKKVAFNLHHSKSTPSMLLRNAQNFCQKQTQQPRLLSSSTILHNHSSSISKHSLYVGSPPSCTTSNKEESSSSIDSLYLVFADQVRNCLMWPFHNTGQPPPQTSTKTSMEDVTFLLDAEGEGLCFQSLYEESSA